MARNYGSIALWSIAFITQALSLAGLFADINMIVWTRVIMLGSILLSVVYNALIMLGIMSASSVNQDSATTTANKTATGDFA